MINPWHKRANELVRDPLALLPLISPAPVQRFFKGDSSSLFDRLVIVIGSPGSGKTTLARLLEFPTLCAALDSHERADVRQLLAVLSDAGIVSDLRPRYLAVRIPANAQYRAVWELPYEEDVRHKLLRSLLQSRAVLGWLRQLEAEGVALSGIRIETSGVGDAERIALAADSADGFREVARRTELDVFKVLSALVPPAEDRLSEHVSSIQYDPLLAVSSIIVPEFKGSEEPVALKPMLMIDDAHELHQRQFQDLDRWLIGREVRVARWMLTRIDAISPSEFRRAQAAEEIERPPPGTSPGRDRLVRMLQQSSRASRTAFRAVAADIGKRYLAQVPAFATRGVNTLADTLLNAQPKLNATDLRKLREQVMALRKDLEVSEEAVNAAMAYLPEGAPDDLRLAVTRILLHRESLRSPQRSLFSASAGEDEEQVAPRKIDRAVVTGAELQLLHEFRRPFFYGFDRLSDASSENIEQFISLASVLVDELETLMIRGKRPQLDAKRQHDALATRAACLMGLWDFPYAARVRQLVDFISRQCTKITLRPNAPLDDGANAFGVPQADLKLLETDADLERVIHYALAYQAINMIEEYNCKGQEWCLFELGGIPAIAAGLTLGRGGFVEGHLQQLRQVIAR